MDAMTTNVVVRRAFCRDAKRALTRDVVAQQLEELNGLGVRLRSCRRTGRRSREGALRASIGNILDAMAWTREESLRAVWAAVREGTEMPDDALGSAVALLFLEPDRGRVLAWAASLGEASRPALHSAGLDPAKAK
jgi:hypothetical protein